jgi:hypothetical protein
MDINSLILQFFACVILATVLCANAGTPYPTPAAEPDKFGVDCVLHCQPQAGFSVD